MESLMELLRNGVFYLAHWTVWYLLLKDNFKYNSYVIFIMFFAYVLVEQFLMRYNMQTTIFMGIAMIYDYIYQSFLYKGNIINSYNLDFFILLIGNILPNLFIVVIVLGTSLLSGSSAEWFNKTDMTVGMEFVMDISIVVGFAITYAICRKLKATVLNFRSFWKYFFFFFGVMPGMLSCVLRTMVEPDYDMSPSGVIFYLDMFTMCLCVIATVVILTRSLLQKRRINQCVTQRMEEEYQMNQHSFALQQELRELNHEIKNQLIARGGVRSYKDDGEILR